MDPARRACLFESARALAAAKPLLRRLDAAGGPTVWLVGGAVRDLLLGREPHELDLCVDGELEALDALLGGSARAHERFGTRTVELDGARYDLARTRSETYAHAGALPDVAPAGIDRDLARRDFTVNAIALALTGPERGELRAVAGAEADLAAGALRVLHERSFLDDPTRLLRLVRYRTRLGFAVEPVTARLAGEAVAGAALASISGTRLGNELRLLACEPDPVGALSGLGELGAEQAIAPGFGLREPPPVTRALALLPVDGRRDLLTLGSAFAGVDGERRGPRVTELGFTAADAKVIDATAGLAADTGRRLAAAVAAGAPPSAIATVLGGLAPETVALAGALGGTPGAEAAARAWLTEGRHVRLELTGEDLIAAGVAPGPELGAALRAALAAKRDGLAAGCDAELQAALASLGRR